MCPACISTMVMIAASALPTGGLAAFIAKKVDVPAHAEKRAARKFEEKSLKED